MNAEHGVDDVLRAIAAGTPVDWAAAESTAADDSGRGVIRELKVIAGIAAVHRTLHAAPDHAWDAGRPAVASWGGLALLERVGHGVFGDVYRAWDRRLDREVALKLLRHRDEQRDAGSAVIHEGRLLARVRHPNVVTVHGADRIEGDVGLWMEFIHGRTLEQVVRKDGPFGAGEAAVVGLDVCRGLSAVHAAGLVHRDVKAQNVMREDGGRIVLMDFGAGQPSDDVVGGDLAGTPLYLAPEVLEGVPATFQSDLYSVGVLLYHLVTGSYPVRGATLGDIREGNRHGRRTLLRDARADLPETFVEVVERALAHDPSERYQSAGALEAALSRVMALAPQPSSAGETTREIEPPLSRSRTRRFPRRRVMAAVAGMAALALGGLVAWRWNAQTAAIPPLAFHARDWILVVPFENRSSDSSFDGAIEAALEHERLEKVTTPSLKALRLYTESYALGDRGQWPAALELVKQAVAQDPDFAAAQIWLAWALLRTGRPSAEYLPPATRAMQLADRTSDWERLAKLLAATDPDFPLLLKLQRLQEQHGRRGRPAQ